MEEVFCGLVFGGFGGGGFLVVCDQRLLGWTFYLFYAKMMILSMRLVFQTVSNV